MDIDKSNIATGPDFKAKCQSIGNKVNTLRKEAKCFKIGMTSDPDKRSESDDYCNGRYDTMKILYRTTSEVRVGSMEDYLIQRFKKYDSCDNIARGGIGKLKWGPPYYVYIVYKKT